MQKFPFQFFSEGRVTKILGPTQNAWGPQFDRTCESKDPDWKILVPSLNNVVFMFSPTDEKTPYERQENRTVIRFSR